MNCKDKIMKYHHRFGLGVLLFSIFFAIAWPEYGVLFSGVACVGLVFLVWSV